MKEKEISRNSHLRIIFLMNQRKFPNQLCIQVIQIGKLKSLRVYFFFLKK